MVERLKQPKDSSVDLTNMKWNTNVATVAAADYKGSVENDGFTFLDKVGILASQNVRGLDCLIYPSLKLSFKTMDIILYN